MRIRSLLIILALLVVCQSCGVKDSYRRRSYIAKNPELREPQKTDILKGRLQAGMTRDMVRASLGEPTSTSATTTFTGTVKERWSYDREGETITVEFRDGRVVGWNQERKEDDK